MEVINKNVAFLSNCEVYSLLKQTKEDQAKKILRKKIQAAQNATSNTQQLEQLQQQQQLVNINIDKHLPTIVYESLRYLEKTCCVNQTPEIVSEFLRKCKEKEFQLTKTEKLQLINHRPTTLVELQVLIEDAEERFTVEQIDEILDFVQDNLPTAEV